MVVGRTNRRDVAPSGGRTKQIIKATHCSGDHIRSIVTTNSKESGRLLTCNMNTDQDTTVVQCTAVSQPDGLWHQAKYLLDGGQPNIYR